MIITLTITLDYIAVVASFVDVSCCLITRLHHLHDRSNSFDVISGFAFKCVGGRTWGEQRGRVQRVQTDFKVLISRASLGGEGAGALTGTLDL